MKKPREFWIDEYKSHLEAYSMKRDFRSQIHLIEKSAYDKAVEVLKQTHVEMDNFFVSPTAVRLIANMEKVLKELGELIEKD